MRKRKYLIVAIHIIIWVFFASIPLLIFSQHPFERTFTETLQNYSYWVFLVSFIFLYYFTTYYLIPKFYLRGKYYQYAVGMFLVFVGFFLLKPFELMFYYNTPQSQEIAYNPWSFDVITIFTFIVVVSCGIVVQIIRQWRNAEKRALKAEAEKANAELAFLKAQINPHFLFNTLNNIYSLAVTQNANTSPSIMKLSNILRYITDDATKEFVELDRELACIRDYINLQSLRLGKRMQVEFDVSGKTVKKKIAPLILMTFIENIFKYGITNHEAATITIKLFSDDKKINFFCQNRIFAHQSTMETTGIGLANTRHRLELIYPNKHTLDIDNENGLFTVHLTLQD